MNEKYSVIITTRVDAQVGDQLPPFQCDSKRPAALCGRLETFLGLVGFLRCSGAKVAGPWPCGVELGLLSGRLESGRREHIAAPRTTCIRVAQ